MKNRTLKKKGGFFFGSTPANKTVGVTIDDMKKEQSNATPANKTVGVTIDDMKKEQSNATPANKTFGVTKHDMKEQSDATTDRSSDSSETFSFGPDSFGPDSFGPDSFGPDSFGPDSKAISQKSYSWDSFVKRVSTSTFLDSFVNERVKVDRLIKKDLNIVRAQLALLDSIINGNDTLYQTVGAKQAAERVAVTNNLNKFGILHSVETSPQEQPSEKHICSKYPEIITTYPDATSKIQSLMCAFGEIADHFPSIEYGLPEGRNIFHFLALATIQSKGVGIKSKANSFLSSGFKTETQTKSRDQEIMDTVLKFLCENTTPNETYPSRLKQFLQGNDGIQKMLSARDLYGKTPIDIIKSQGNSTARNSCFINNIITNKSGGKSRRSRKQNKRALKKSKKSRKTARKQ